MACEVRETGERLQTNRTLERFFSRVQSLVHDSVRFGIEGARAKFARKARLRRGIRRLRRALAIELIAHRIFPLNTMSVNIEIFY